MRRRETGLAAPLPRADAAGVVRPPPASAKPAAGLLARLRPKPPSEHVGIAVPFAYWVRSNMGLYRDLENGTAIPHAEQSKRQAGRKWAEGVQAGYPDWLLDVARGPWHGLRIELKRPCHWPDGRDAPLKAGCPSLAQQAWHQRLARAGYFVAVCWRWQSARDVVLYYLSHPLGDAAATWPGPPYTQLIASGVTS